MAPLSNGYWIYLRKHRPWLSATLEWALHMTAISKQCPRISAAPRTTTAFILITWALKQTLFEGAHACM